MFQLYKDRKFSDYISDTINFFKTSGKHYFKNYFIINGSLLIILSVIFYFIGKMFGEVIEGNIVTNKSNIINDYFNNNMGLFIVVIIFVVLLLIIISILNYSYPSIYVKLYEERNTLFNHKDIVKRLKQKFRKLLVFSVLSLFVMTPIIIVILGLNILLCFILIGFPILLIIFPAIISWVSLSFNNYILDEVSYFKALQNGYTMLFNKFWEIVGSTLVVFVILYILQTFITMIPYFIGILVFFATGLNEAHPENQHETFNAIFVFIIGLMIFSTLLSVIFQNFLYIQQVLVYYSQVENQELKIANDEIELIGNGE